MNFFKAIIVKSILVVVITASCMTFQHCNAAAGPSTLPENAGPSKKYSLTSEQREYIHKLILEIEGIFSFFQHKIELFLDNKDKTPYRNFVGDLCGGVDKFKKETVQPLKQRIKDSVVKDEFYQGLVIVDELLTEFLDKLGGMQQILLKYVSSKSEQALKLANELQKPIQELIAKEVWTKLEAKLFQVETLMKQIEERDIMLKLAQLKTVLAASQKGSAALKISPTMVVSFISKRMRYN